MAPPRVPPMFYGNEKIADFLPPTLGSVEVIRRTPEKPLENLEKRLYHVLEETLESQPLEKLVEKHGNNIVVTVDDHTRPNVHTRAILPYLLPKLEGYGAKDIRILFATGTHRRPTTKEQEQILGKDVYKQYKDQLLIHDSDDKNSHKLIGTTSYGTPVGIDKRIMEASLLIPVGDIGTHYFAGISGIHKQLGCPGCASSETVSKNHVKMFDPDLGFRPECKIGGVEDNPVLDEILQIADMVSNEVPVLGINAIVDGGEVTYLNAGNIRELFNESAQRVVEMHTYESKGFADISVVQVGKLGLDLYQAGKGIHAAWNGVKSGGKIVLLAPCDGDPNYGGVGNEAYKRMMLDVEGMSTKEALTHVLHNYCTEGRFQIGYQKVVDLLRILDSVGEGNIYLLSEMKPKLVRKLRLEPVEKSKNESAESALKRFLTKHCNSETDLHLFYSPELLIKTDN